MPHNYTTAEIAYIKANKGKMSVKDIAKRLGVTAQAISNLCYKRGIKDVTKQLKVKVIKHGDKQIIIKDLSNVKYIKKDSRTWVAVRA
jgi:predicted transcriptional regulator